MSSRFVRRVGGRSIYPFSVAGLTVNSPKMMANMGQAAPESTEISSTSASSSAARPSTSVSQ